MTLHVGRVGRKISATTRLVRSVDELLVSQVAVVEDQEPNETAGGLCRILGTLNEEDGGSVICRPTSNFKVLSMKKAARMRKEIQVLNCWKV